MNPVATRPVNATEGFWAVVPVKCFAGAKQRLMPLLSLHERRTLTGAMLGDVLSALVPAPGLAGVLVVTAERSAAAMARAAGATVMNDGDNAGMNAAVAHAAQRLVDLGASAMLVIPADLPLITTADVETIARAHRAAPSVTLVAAANDGGTNALACSPPLAIVARFGEDSLHRHREAARAAGISAVILRLERIGHDMDRPADSASFLLRPSPTQSYAYLVSSGIAQRLRGFDRDRCGKAPAAQAPDD